MKALARTKQFSIITLIVLFFYSFSSAYAVRTVILDKESEEGKEYDRLRSAQAKSKKNTASAGSTHDHVVDAKNILSISDGIGNPQFTNKSQASKILKLRKEIESKKLARLKQIKSKNKKGAGSSGVEIQAETDDSTFQIVATDFEVDESIKSKYENDKSICLVKMDNNNTAALGEFRERMNFVVAGRTLCHCLSEHPERNCGGLNLGVEEGYEQGLIFFRDVVSTLDTEDPHALAILDGEHRHQIALERGKSFTVKVLRPESEWDMTLRVFEKKSEENILKIAQHLELEFPQLEFDMVYYKYSRPEGFEARVFQGLRVHTKSTEETTVVKEQTDSSISDNSSI